MCTLGHAPSLLGTKKEGQAPARRYCPSLVWWFLHIQLSLALHNGHIQRVLTIQAGCDEMQCNKNNSSLLPYFANFPHGSVCWVEVAKQGAALTQYPEQTTSIAATSPSATSCLTQDAASHSRANCGWRPEPDQLAQGILMARTFKRDFLPSFWGPQKDRAWKKKLQATNLRDEDQSQATGTWTQFAWDEKYSLVATT